MNRDELVRKMHSRLDQWNHEIEHLMAKTEDAEASVRDEWHSRLDELRAHRDRANISCSKSNRPAKAPGAISRAAPNWPGIRW